MHSLHSCVAGTAQLRALGTSPDTYHASWVALMPTRRTTQRLPRQGPPAAVVAAAAATAKSGTPRNRDAKILDGRRSPSALLGALTHTSRNGARPCRPRRKHTPGGRCGAVTANRRRLLQATPAARAQARAMPRAVGLPLRCPWSGLQGTMLCCGGAAQGRRHHMYDKQATQAHTPTGQHTTSPGKPSAKQMQAQPMHGNNAEAPCLADMGATCACMRPRNAPFTAATHLHTHCAG